MNSYTTDNRWSPSSSGAIVPEAAPAAYSARWIDMGDTTPADVVPDRQGFAYSRPEDRDRLIAFMQGDTMIRTPSYTCIPRDKTTVVVNHPEWHMYQRRAGGYIYVDAWLAPVQYVCICPDGEMRHVASFSTEAEAREFADTGHACLAAKHHSIRPVTS